MLKGWEPDSLNALKAQRESALKELQEQYAQAMGLGEKKPKASVKTDAKNDKDFWDGFRKGLGLKEEEEVGGGLRDMGFAAQNSAAHIPGLILDDYLYIQDSEEENEPGPEPGPHPSSEPDSSSTEDGYDEVQPLINPDAAVDEEGIIDRDDFDTNGDYWDAVEDALNEYIANNDPHGAVDFIQSNELDLSEMHMYLPGMMEEISEIINREGIFISTPPDPNPIVDDHVYITEDEYQTFLAEIKEQNGWSGGPIPGAGTLIENRIWSRLTEMSDVTENTTGFNSADEAAIAFLKAYQGTSQSSNLEYGVVIYESGGRYYLGETNIGTADGVTEIFWESVFNPCGLGSVVGTVHTHSSEYDAFGTNSRNNSFSGMDLLLPGIRYLGAPNGTVYRSEAADLPNEIVYTGLPVASGSVTSPQFAYDNVEFFPELGKRISDWFNDLLYH